MYIIQEMQTNAEGVVAFLPPVQKATRIEAESEYHIKAGYAAISSVPVHTVMCFTEEGFEVLKPIVYRHPVQPAPAPIEVYDEPAEEPTEEETPVEEEPTEEETPAEEEPTEEETPVEGEG